MKKDSQTLFVNEDRKSEHMIFIYWTLRWLKHNQRDFIPTPILLIKSNVMYLCLSVGVYVSLYPEKSQIELEQRPFSSIEQLELYEFIFWVEGYIC